MAIGERERGFIPTFKPDDFAPEHLHEKRPPAFQRAHEFKVGDIVFLKSGSPAMTVNSLRGGSQTGRMLVSVEWFAGTELKRDCFDPECLTTEKASA